MTNALPFQTSYVSQSTISVMFSLQHGKSEDLSKAVTLRNIGPDRIPVVGIKNIDPDISEVI